MAWRTSVDILINNNDGALFASPTTHPGQVLNGVELKGKTFPEFLQVIENPNLNAPGMVAVMTFKFGSKIDGPNRIVLTNLGQVGAGQWDVVAQQAGDSACAIFWEPKRIRPGQKREMAWAYGGGIASNPEGEGKVALSLGGNLEPGKLFSLQAMVEDPTLGQTLRLELPAGDRTGRRERDRAGLRKRREPQQRRPLASPGDAAGDVRPQGPFQHRRDVHQDRDDRADERSLAILP